MEDKMSMMNGEGYGRSIDERIDNAVEDAFGGKPGFGSVHQEERDKMRESLNREFGLFQEEEDEA
jgi:hypothetical protein